MIFFIHSFFSSVSAARSFQPALFLFLTCFVSIFLSILSCMYLTQHLMCMCIFIAMYVHIVSWNTKVVKFFFIRIMNLIESHFFFSIFLNALYTYQSGTLSLLFAFSLSSVFSLSVPLPSSSVFSLFLSSPFVFSLSVSLCLLLSCPFVFSLYHIRQRNMEISRDRQGNRLSHCFRWCSLVKSDAEVIYSAGVIQVHLQNLNLVGKIW